MSEITIHLHPDTSKQDQINFGKRITQMLVNAGLDVKHVYSLKLDQPTEPKSWDNFDGRIEVRSLCGDDYSAVIENNSTITLRSRFDTGMSICLITPEFDKLDHYIHPSHPDRTSDTPLIYSFESIRLSSLKPMNERTLYAIAMTAINVGGKIWDYIDHGVRQFHILRYGDTIIPSIVHIYENETNQFHVVRKDNSSSTYTAVDWWSTFLKIDFGFDNTPNELNKEFSLLRHCQVRDQQITTGQ